jgi:putative chitinase
MIHRAYFFASVRYYLDSTQSLTQEQVDGFETLLATYEAAPDAVDDRMLAYILATSWHETAFRMQPIAEYGKGSGKSYGQPAGPYGQCYYGRGYVQLTWLENYQRQDTKLALNGQLVKNADLALDPVIAAQILFGGMVDGDFTGKKLRDFFTLEETDWYNARTIVNAHDCATDIASYAEKFCNALSHTFDAPRA